MKRTISLVLSLLVLFNLTAVNVLAASPSSSQLHPEGQKSYEIIVNAVQQHKDTVEIPNIDLKERNRINAILRYEHPEFFYLKKLKPGMLNSYSDGTQYEKIRLEYDSTAQKAFQDLLAKVPRNISDYDKELAVHDLLVKQTEHRDQVYDYDNCQAVYNCLVNHTSDHAGYAYLMKLLLNKLDIPCEVIQGKGPDGQNLFWNRVTLNGKDYLTDVSLDDTIDLSEEQPFIYYQYFNRSKAEMERDHTPDHPSEEKSCVYNDQGYYKKNGLYFTSVDSAENFMRETLKRQSAVAVELATTQMALQVRKDFVDGKIADRDRGIAASQYQNGLANNVLIVRVGTFR